MKNEKYCIATVTCESFFIGTMVMIASFLKHNRWFEKENGEIVIIHDALPTEYQRKTAVFKNVTFRQVSDGLKEKVEVLSEKLPKLGLASRGKRFFSLETFRLRGYRKVLFCDSDIIFRDNVSELFGLGGGNYHETERILAAGDRNYFLDNLIDPRNYSPVEPKAKSCREGMITESFGVGVFVADESLLTERTYQALLELLDVGEWKDIEDDRTVHVVLNRYFRDRCRHVSVKYNFPIIHEDLVSRKEQIRGKDVKILHFNGKTKPWECLKVLDSVIELPHSLKYVPLWYKEYLEFLPKYHLLQQFQAGDP